MAGYHTHHYIFLNVVCKHKTVDKFWQGKATPKTFLTPFKNSDNG